MFWIVLGIVLLGMFIYEAVKLVVYLIVFLIITIFPKIDRSFLTKFIR